MKKIVAIFLLCLAFTTLFACKDTEHVIKDFQSETSGLNRHIKVMTANGEVIAEYDGYFDIKESSNGVLFQIDGKRYAYYNCFVEAVEK